MRNWSDIKGTEQDMKDFCEVFRSAFNTDLKKLADAPGEAKKYKGGIYMTALADANRNEYSVNGEAILLDSDTSAASLTEKLEHALPDPKDRQYISKLCNQRMWADIQMASAQGMTSSGVELKNIPGSERLASVPYQGHTLLIDPKEVAHLPNTFDIKVSEDGKHATIKATLDQLVSHYDGKSIDGAQPGFGMVNFTYTMECDLNGAPGGQNMTSLQFSQAFRPLQPARA